MDRSIKQIKPPIVIVGPTGSGKTTVGKLLAFETDKPFLDMDREIETRCGCNINLIFDIEGEEGFRERESRLLEEIVKKEAVIATGAGIVLSWGNRKILSDLKSSVIWLQADLETQMNRLSHDKCRPLLREGNLFNRLKEMAKIRGPLYEEVSGKKVETKDHTPQELSKIICSIFKEKNRFF